MQHTQDPATDQARQFLAALGNTHTFQTFDDKAGRKLPRLAKVINGVLDQDVLGTLINLNMDGAGIFVTVNATDGHGRKRQNITRTRAIYGDFDGEDAIALFDAAAAKLPPSIVVASSPSKRHAYWLVDMEPEAGEVIQHKMPEVVGCDPAAKDISRVLRIPGFYHNKGEPVRVELLECHSDRRYEAWEIVAAFGLDDITKPKAKGDRVPQAQESASAGNLDDLISEHDAAKLRDALKYVGADGKRVFDPANRAHWVAVGAALARSGDIGFKLFHEWSAEAGSAGGYAGEDDCREKFDNDFAINSKSHYRAIFSGAQGAGWWQREVPASQFADFGVEPAPDEVPPPERHTAPVGWPPGLVGEIAAYILNSSRMQVPSFAIAGALSVTSHLIRNMGHVGPSKTGLNLYLVLIGMTGKGKEDPRKAIKRLLDAMDDRDIAGRITENMSSGTALLRSLAFDPNLMMMCDEYGIFMQASMSGKDEHRRDLVKELMSLYGLALSFHGGKRYAKACDNIARMNNPYVVVLGTTTEEELFAGLNMTSINNGSANRNIYTYADVDAKPNRSPDTEIPADLIQKLKHSFGTMCDNEIIAMQDGPTAMQYGPGAEELVVEFGDNLPTTGKFVNLWSRAEENAVRIAGVLAYCDGKVITVEHVRWAIEYVRASINEFDVRSETQITEGYFDKLLAKALNIIGNPRHYIDDHKFREHTSKGKMPRGKLLNLMKIKAKELDEVIDNLVQSKQIKQGETGNTRVFWV